MTGPEGGTDSGVTCLSAPWPYPSPPTDFLTYPESVLTPPNICATCATLADLADADDPMPSKFLMVQSSSFFAQCAMRLGPSLRAARLSSAARPAFDGEQAMLYAKMFECVASCFCLCPY